MNRSEFYAIPNGTRVVNHFYDQCVALANLYHEDVEGGRFVPVDSAFQWWTLFDQLPMLKSHYTKASKPQAGDIFIARYGIYNGLDGHIGVVQSVNKNGTFNTMEQNAGTWRYVGRYTRNLDNVLGFLRPKSGAPTPSPAPTTRKVKQMFMVYYAKGNPKGGPGWFVVGTPNPEILVTSTHANNIASRIGSSAIIVESQSGWEKFLRMGGYTRAEIKKMYG